MLFPPVANEDVNKRVLSGHVGLTDSQLSLEPDSHPREKS